MGYTRTLAGRLRYLESEEAHNEFYNTPVQGSGADGLKRAMREVYFRLKKLSPWNGAVKMVHHVHDEILTEIDDNDELDRLVRRALQDGMREGMACYVTKVPVKVVPESGPSWGEAKA